MDDFNVTSLHESKNEWSARLVTTLTPLLIGGCNSILNEAVNLCKENGEPNKYLMTFQNLIARVPKWNMTIVETETKRIIEKSKCDYLEELVACVHIIQLKILTSARVGSKQKKIEMKIPKLPNFIHSTYIYVARKIYQYTYLFEINLPPLERQKRNRELEILVQECIMNALRDSIPVDTILRAYIDETVEEDVTKEVTEKMVEEPVPAPSAPSAPSVPPVSPISHVPGLMVEKSIMFNPTDYIKNADNSEEELIRNTSINEGVKRENRGGSGSDHDDSEDKLVFGDTMSLDELAIEDFDKPATAPPVLLPDLMLDEDIIEL